MRIGPLLEPKPGHNHARRKHGTDNKWGKEAEAREKFGKMGPAVCSRYLGERLAVGGGELTVAGQSTWIRPQGNCRDTPQSLLVRGVAAAPRRGDHGTIAAP